MGKRTVSKHRFGKEKKRKAPLEDYDSFSAVAEVRRPDKARLKHDLSELKKQHDIGLIQILDSSTDSAPDIEGTDLQEEHLTPEEVVHRKLQVSLNEGYQDLLKP